MSLVKTTMVLSANAEVIDSIEHLADMGVHLGESVGEIAVACLACKSGCGSVGKCTSVNGT